MLLCQDYKPNAEDGAGRLFTADGTRDIPTLNESSVVDRSEGLDHWIIHLEVLNQIN